MGGTAAGTIGPEEHGTPPVPGITDASARSPVLAAMSFARRLATARTLDDVAAAAVVAAGRISTGRVALAVGRSTAFVRATEGWGTDGPDPVGSVCRPAVIEQHGMVVAAGDAFAELGPAAARIPLLVLQIRVRGMREGALLIEADPETASAEWPSLLADAVGAAIDRIHRTEGSGAALQDPLTGAASRLGLEVLLQHATLRPGHVLGVVSCDLERFRLVNEALGWAAGDDLLRATADRLAAAAGAGGRVARLSADEFAVVYADLETEAELADRRDELAAALGAPLEVAGETLFPSASFGLAACAGTRPGASAVALEVLRTAQANQHDARRTARPSRPRLDALDLLRLDADLHTALDDGQITAHFQPVYELSSRRPIGFEVLARWTHPRFGPVAPAVFIDLAEDNGLISRIGDRMLVAARDFMRASGNADIALQVNASIKEISEPGYADHVAVIFEGDRRSLSRLTIEITESSLVLDLERVSTELLALRALGIGIAIDDFGTGYSSLAQLQDLPATALKIDRGLVQRDGVVGQTVIELILQLATGLGLQAVAEGVETPEQLLTLTALGCSHAQGFLFSPALPYRSALALAAEFA